jgi:hypothetical protein
MSKVYLFIILTISIVTASLYISGNPIDFHCDSATFYNYGSQISSIFKKIFFITPFLLLFLFYFNKKFKINKRVTILIIVSILITFVLILFSIFHKFTPYSISNFSRPPVYPFFLFLTGVYLFDTFLVHIILQGIISLFCICFIFSILKYLTNIHFAFICTIIYSLTSIPYILITFIGAEQLLFFFSIIYIFSLVHFYRTKKIKYLFIGGVASTLAWLTRWEGQILFYNLILFITIIAANEKKSIYFIKKSLPIFIIPIIILLTWTSGRSVLTKDFSGILKVTNVTNDQFFWKFYSVIPHQIFFYEEKFNIKKQYTGKFNHWDIYPNEPPGTLIVRSENGKFSKEYFDQVYSFLNQNQGIYKEMKKPLEDSDAANNINLYYELFDKFDGNNVEIARNIENQPSVFYFNFINEGLNKTIGQKKKDIIYKNAIFESLKENPLIIFISLADFMQVYGMDIKNGMIYNKIPYSNVANGDFFTIFNGGTCATNNLTSKTYKEYESSHLNKKELNLYKFNDSINDFIRNYLGIFFIFSYIILMIKNFKLMFPLILLPILLDLTTTIANAPPTNSKYEITPFTINFILLSLFFYYLLKFKIKK